jgi:hypothetical protein
MAVALRQSRSFGADSPVTRYWLANCVGFAVTGGVRGHVEEVVAEDDPNEPELLVVRLSAHRTRRLPVSAVRSAVPTERVLVVEHVPGGAGVHSRQAAQVAGRGAEAGARLLARLCVLGWTWACRGWAAGRPVAAAGLRRGGQESARLIASVPWHRFGPSVRSATTRLWPALSRLWSRLRTTWSGPSSGSDSAADPRTTSSG